MTTTTSLSDLSFSTSNSTLNQNRLHKHQSLIQQEVSQPYEVQKFGSAHSGNTNGHAHQRSTSTFDQQNKENNHANHAAATSTTTHKPATNTSSNTTLTHHCIHPFNVINEQLLKNVIYNELVRNNPQDLHLIPSVDDIDIYANATITDSNNSSKQQANSNSITVRAHPQQQPITKLQLSYQHLAQITNLHHFSTTLTHLQLDNNSIASITGLENLVNLKWLDLSFNKLQQVENLQTLTKLTDLNLSYNQLASPLNVQQLLQLPLLNFLSLASNKLTNLEDIKQLRSCANLRALVVQDNNFNNLNTAELHTFVLAYIPTLKYIDYKAIHPTMIAKARDSYLDEILVLEQQELNVRKEKLLVEETVALHARYEQHQIGCLYQFFDKLVQNDTEMNVKIRGSGIVGIEKLIENYSADITHVLNGYVNEVFNLGELKKNEQLELEKVRDDVNTKGEVQSKQWIDELHVQHQQLQAQYSAVDFDTLTTPAELTPYTTSLQQYEQQLDALVHRLMELEIYTSQQNTSLVEQFEVKWEDIHSKLLNSLILVFRQLTTISISFFSSLGMHIVEHTIVESNKEMLLVANTNSREYHDAYLAEKETEIRDAESEVYKNYLQQLKTTEYRRNRGRVYEIYEGIEKKEKQWIKEWKAKIVGEEALE